MKFRIFSNLQINIKMFILKKMIFKNEHILNKYFKRNDYSLFFEKTTQMITFFIFINKHDTNSFILINMTKTSLINI